jgi:predicted house-cleaning noncanonical NTP pyrophosphatase (MazG superfamily)
LSGYGIGELSVRQEYNKLVRDQIPDLIQESGYECDTVQLSEEEYQQALRDKLIEEAQEAATASPEQLGSELADLLDVIDALIESAGISQETILLERDQKRATKGSFTKKIKLLWVE